MKDGNKLEDVVITAEETQGFYTYSEKDGVYKLDGNGADNIKALADGGNYTYKDEAGYGVSLVITTAYDKKNVSYAEVNSTASANASYTLTFGAVKLNGATVTDLRSAGTINNDVHNIEIDDVSELKAATKVADINADVYFDKGVTFIAVKSLTAKPKSFAAADEEVDTIEKVNAMLAAGDDVEITGAWAPSGAAALAVGAGCWRWQPDRHRRRH